MLKLKVRGKLARAAHCGQRVGQRPRHDAANALRDLVQIGHAAGIHELVLRARGGGGGQGGVSAPGREGGGRPREAQARGPAGRGATHKHAFLRDHHHNVRAPHANAGETTGLDGLEGVLCAGRRRNAAGGGVGVSASRLGGAMGRWASARAVKVQTYLVEAAVRAEDCDHAVIILAGGHGASVVARAAAKNGTGATGSANGR